MKGFKGTPQLEYINGEVRVMNKAEAAKPMVREIACQGQDETGRYYSSKTERDRASGRLIQLSLALKCENSKGLSLERVTWLHGNINTVSMGPKRWAKYLEKNMDSIVKDALKYFKKENKSYELMGVLGWRIIDKRITSTNNMFHINAGRK